MPREIPIPRHASPTSSRCGSYHGSLASATVVPPFLSLEPPGPSLPPPSNYHAFRQPDSFSSNGGDDSYSEGLRPRKVVLHIGRDRGGRDVGMKLSPIGKPSLIDDQELSGSRDGFSMRSEDSVEKNWRESFYKKSDVSPKELVVLRQSARLALTMRIQTAERRIPSTAAPELGAILRQQPPTKAQ